MSELFEKLRPPERVPGTKATATLKQLMARWGVVELVHLRGMDSPEVWRLVHAKGIESLFERQESP